MVRELTNEEASALAHAVQHDPDYAVFLLDAQGIILTWNVAAERIKGYTPEEAIGQHFRILFPREDVSSFKPEYELRVAASTGRYEEHAWRLRRGGEPFWAHVHLTPRRDAQGNVVGYVKITRDLTSQKRAEDSQRASEERYRILVDSVKDYAIFLLDPTGKVRTWNTGAQRIKGYAPAEIIGQHFSRFYPLEDRERGRPGQLLARAAEQGRVEDEGWRVRKDGTRFWADVVITAIRAPDGRLIGFSKVTRDLTEREAGQAERADLQRRARETLEANRRLEAFSYTVAHDLKAPIRAVAALAETILTDHRQSLPDEAAHMLERVCRTAEKMGGLVEDLLNFSRADKGDLHPQKVDLGAMAQHILQQTLQKRDADRVGDLVVDPDLVVWGDPSLLRIVMDNLLGNAWKFTSTRPRYRIEIRKREGDATHTISVKDNGVGFPAARVGEIFQPFRRLHGPHEFAGTGIGLSTVERIVQRHGGRVWAESHEGQGATFSFSLPREPPPAGPSSSAPG